MTPLLEELVRKASNLSTEERQLLAERLLADTESAPLSDVDEAWLEEAEKRFAAWKSGQIAAVDATEALAEIRRELRK
jgi:hypothetical protein